MSATETSANATTLAPVEGDRPQWGTAIPFFLIHLMPLGALWTGATKLDWILCIAFYFMRLFFITAGYHRYFAHRSFKTGRVMQFIFAFGGATAAQKGVLWWSGNHRHHHRHSDDDEDLHSPKHGIWWSHFGWILSSRSKPTPMHLIKDFAKYPEIRFIDKYYLLPPTVLGLFCFAVGGWSGLWIGFGLSTVLAYHGTFLVNSFTHIWGRRRFVTSDTSRNSMIIALVTMGEGWHNNHHHYQRSCRQGFYWWEIDLTFYILTVMSWFGLVWDLHRPTERALTEGRIKDGHFDVGMFDAYWAKASQKMLEAQVNASRRMREAHLNAEAYAEAKRKALDEFVESTKDRAREVAAKSDELIESTKQTAEDVARLAKGPAGVAD